MVKRLTIDSSVIISSLLRNELKHKEALTIWNNLLNGECFAIMPYSVFVEIVSAIRRRTGSDKMASEIGDQLLKINNLNFVVLDEKSAREAASIAIKTGVRGMDALVIQVAMEYDTELISFDDEMMQKSKKIFTDK